MGYGGDRGGGRFQRFEQREHKAQCADCGAECTVPFKPTEGRPVYCRNCYQNHKKY